MSKIDKEFFEDFYKFDQKEQKMKFNLENDILIKKKLSRSDNRQENLSNDLIKREGDKQNFVSQNNKNVSIKSELSMDLYQKEHLMDIDDENYISNNNSDRGNRKNTDELQNDYNDNNDDFFNDQLNNRLDEQNELRKIININKKKELVYEFAIYHPLKNNKTQEILILGSSYLHQLKDKIYCVLDEIQSCENNQASFLFIENCFFNDTRNPHNKILSSKILENKIRKLNCFTSYGNEFNNTANKYSNLSYSNSNNNAKITYNNSNLISGRVSNFDYPHTNLNYEMGYDYKGNMENDKNFQNPNEELKFAFYDKDLYSVPFYISNEIYDEVSMGDKKINEINFRIGYPYLFRHIDHCDHMIMLTDIRFLDDCDRFDEENKCFVTFQKKLKRRICDACSFYYAKFISINDKITPDYKVLFYCESCLKKIHASEFKDPSIPNTLKLIPYFHD